MLSSLASNRPDQDGTGDEEMATIKRVTNKQKKIINHILEMGVYAFHFGEAYDDTAYLFDVTEDEVRTCVNYVEAKFFFV